MKKIELVTWSWKVTHLYLNEPHVFSNGDIIPVGVLCGRKPSRQALRMYKGGMLTVPFGDTQRYGYVTFCKSCQNKMLRHKGLSNNIGLLKEKNK